MYASIYLYYFLCIFIWTSFMCSSTNPPIRSLHLKSSCWHHFKEHGSYCIIAFIWMFICYVHILLCLFNFLEKHEKCSKYYYICVRHLIYSFFSLLIYVEPHNYARFFLGWKPLLFGRGKVITRIRTYVIVNIGLLIIH